MLLPGWTGRTHLDPAIASARAVMADRSWTAACSKVIEPSCVYAVWMTPSAAHVCRHHTAVSVGVSLLVCDTALELSSNCKSSRQHTHDSGRRPYCNTCLLKTAGLEMCANIYCFTAGSTRAHRTVTNMRKFIVDFIGASSVYRPGQRTSIRPAW